MVEESEPTMASLFLGLIICLIIGIVASLIAYRMGFFRYPKDSPKKGMGEASPISIGRLVGAVLVYIGVSIIVALLIAAIASTFLAAKPAFAITLMRWGIPISSAALFVGMLCYAAACGGRVRVWLWGMRGVVQPKERSRFYNAWMGVAALFVAGPIVYALSDLIMILLTWSMGSVQDQQLVVSKLKEMAPYPFAAIGFFVSIVFLIPVVEEIVFRGFLLGWLRRHMGRQSAIWLSSVIFGLVHFSLAQGAANIYILPPLILLGWFLGHLFEKYRMLFAPILLHILFNAIASVLILATVWSSK